MHNAATPLSPNGEHSNAVAALSCPYCGSAHIYSLPDKELPSSTIVTPYYCNRCQRTFASGPFHTPQKTPQ
jgi:DNA-directed RNA polymerase subunit RPC12/RpoP